MSGDYPSIDLSEMPRPPPPVVGKVTHHSVELYWIDAMKKLNDLTFTRNTIKGDGRIRVIVQEEDKCGSWGNVYTGYSKKHIIEGLEPLQKFKYRIRFKNNTGETVWSQPVDLSTTKEPLTSEHLHKAVNRENISEIEHVLDSKDVKIDTPDKHGYTPLMQAAQKGFYKVEECLIKKNAEVDCRNEAGRTALMCACMAGKLKCVQTLISLGRAKVDNKDKGGFSALHYAVDGTATGDQIEIIKYLISEGADINARSDAKWTPLIRVANLNGNREIAALLIKKGADVNALDKDGKSALMSAVINGHLGMCKVLMQNNADIRLKNQYGKDILEMAQSMDRRHVVEALNEYLGKEEERQ